MTEANSSHPYTIRVRHHGSVYELHIPELLLTVRTKDLRDGYERLLKRKREMVDFARSIDALDELPAPAEPPALRSIFR